MILNKKRVMMVEYDDNLPNTDEDYSKPQIKNDCIIIKKVKDSWSRDEVAMIIKSFAADFDDKEFGIKELNKWIEDNL